MSKNIIIRQAKPDDFKYLPDIETAASYTFREFVSDFDTSLPSAPESYYHSLPKASEVFVACSKTKVVGFIVVTTLDNQAYIAELDVLPEYSRQGIGKQLIIQAIDWAKENSFKHITLTTFKNIPFNAPFYSKFGFKEFLPTDEQKELKETRQKEDELFGEKIKTNPRIAMKLTL